MMNMQSEAAEWCKAAAAAAEGVMTMSANRNSFKNTNDDTIKLMTAVGCDGQIALVIDYHSIPIRYIHIHF